jgi:type IV secretion system protein VirB11
MTQTALESFLLPIKPYFEIEGVSEVSINKPKEIWVEKLGEAIRYEVPQFDFEHLKSLARLIAQSTEQRVSEEEPLLSATLPNGFRVQIVFPPACEQGSVVMSIRKPNVVKWTIDDYERMGLFDKVIISKGEDTDELKLKTLLEEGKVRDFIQNSILMKKNLIISGGTSTGKTTFSNVFFGKKEALFFLSFFPNKRKPKIGLFSNFFAHITSSLISVCENFKF